MNFEKRQRLVSLLRKLSPKVVDGGRENISVACPMAPYSPLHRSAVDSRPSMGLRPRDFEPTLIHCFTCGWSAGEKEDGVVKLVRTLSSHEPEFRRFELEAAEVEQIDLGELGAWVEGMDYEAPPTDVRRHFDEWEYSMYARRYPRYLSERGIRLETAKVWESGYDEQEKRAMFPVRDRNGVLVGAVGRSTDGRKPKYKNYWEFDRGNALLGAQLCRHRVGVVVEGVLDAVITYQSLRDHSVQADVVATFGAEFTKAQCDEMCMLFDHVVIAYDSDAAGVAGRERLIRAIRDRVDCRAVYDMQGAHDPGELGSEAYRLVEWASLCY